MRKSVRWRPFSKKGRAEDADRSVVLLPNSAPLSAADARGRLEDAQRTPSRGCPADSQSVARNVTSDSRRAGAAREGHERDLRALDVLGSDSLSPCRTACASHS